MVWKNAVLLFLLYVGAVDVYGSIGDGSLSFRKCLHQCEAGCSLKDSGTEHELSAVEKFYSTQPLYLQLLGWDCTAECKYSCMWKTLKDFQLDGSRVPQFYGKWPFVRCLGMQEPASTIFSALNGLSHILMLRYFRSHVSSSAPLYYLWHVYAAFNINAWLWSTVFHTRDTDFTEKMDYFCAIATVLVTLFACCVRIVSATKRFFIGSCTAAVLVSFYIYHVHYLAFVRFDYGYNMKANVTAEFHLTSSKGTTGTSQLHGYITSPEGKGAYSQHADLLKNVFLQGLANAAAWLIWSYCVYRQQPYVWRVVATVVSALLLLLLEVGDFPPIWWTFDAHSLWHAGTVLLPLLWYRFLVDDCQFLMKQQKQTAANVLKKEC